MLPSTKKILGKNASFPPILGSCPPLIGLLLAALVTRRGYVFFQLSHLTWSFFHSSGVSGSSTLCVFDSSPRDNASSTPLPTEKRPGGIMCTPTLQPASTSLVMAASRASRLIATSVIVTTVERARKVYCNASRRSFFNSRSASVALA